jgi:AcrR family transcriptional regulator
MRLKNKRLQYKEEFRAEVISAGRILLLDEGYEGLSMRKLAAEIGCSPPSLYLYFKDKDALVKEICESDNNQLLEDLEDFAQDESSKPIDRLRKALLFCHDFSAKNPNQYRMAFFSPLTNSGIPKDLMQKDSVVKQSYIIFRSMVQNCIEADELMDKDIDMLTHALTTSMHGFNIMLLHNKHFPRLDRAQLAAIFVNGLLDGYKKEAG